MSRDGSLRFGIAGAALVAVLTATSSAAQESSSWTSTIAPPNARGGEAKMLRTPPVAKGLKPSLGPGTDAARILPEGQRGESMSTFKPAGEPQRGTGSLGTVIEKKGGGNDPAFDAFQQGRYVTAFELATKAAEAGEPQAATLLGRLYQEGLGVKTDVVLAAQWYRRAAELGDTEGMFAFGVLLADGEGIQKNRAGAAQLFDTAAQKGHPLANYNLALLFLKGDGKPENPHRAAIHLRYAAEQGIAAAQYDLATLYATGTGVEANAYHAATWLARSADQGYPDAEVEYGVWLFQGRGVEPSQSRGVQYFKSAAEKGVPVAQNRLARCYSRGAGIPADLVEAAKWHFLARANGIEDKSLDEAIKTLKPEQRLAAQRAAETWRETILLR
jgi:uncharacterized protein